jgi:hypothetical protein
MALEEPCPNFAGLLGESRIACSVIGGESGSKKQSRLMTLDDAEYLFSASKHPDQRPNAKGRHRLLSVLFMPVYSRTRKARIPAWLPAKFE